MKTKTLLTIAGAGLIIGAGFVGEKAEKPALPVTGMIAAGIILLLISMKN